MRKRVVVCAVVMMACVLCLSFGEASAAMRNLLAEFESAVISGDLEKVNTLIKEGLQVNDAVPAVYAMAIGFSAKGVGIGVGLYTLKVTVSEDFIVSLIKRLAKSRANFKDVFAEKTRIIDSYYNDARILRPDILRAFLDAGADPDKRGENMEDSLLFYELGKSAPNLERVKLLVDHKASMTKGIFGFRDHAMRYFLEHQWLESTGRMTECHLKDISAVLEVLRKGGADQSEAKKYLKELRDTHRNVPDALKYIDKVEDAVNGSWCNVSNWGIFALGLTVLFFVL